MPTIDQALGESALLAVSALVFLLAYAGFAYAGGKTKTADPERQKRPSTETTAPTDPANPPNPPGGVGPGGGFTPGGGGGGDGGDTPTTPGSATTQDGDAIADTNNSSSNNNPGGGGGGGGAGTAGPKENDDQPPLTSQEWRTFELKNGTVTYKLPDDGTHLATTIVQTPPPSPLSPPGPGPGPGPGGVGGASGNGTGGGAGGQPQGPPPGGQPPSDQSTGGQPPGGQTAPPPGPVPGGGQQQDQQQGSAPAPPPGPGPQDQQADVVVRLGVGGLLDPDHAKILGSDYRPIYTGDDGRVLARPSPLDLAFITDESGLCSGRPDGIAETMIPEPSFADFVTGLNETLAAGPPGKGSVDVNVNINVNGQSVKVEANPAPIPPLPLVEQVKVQPVGTDHDLNWGLRAAKPEAPLPGDIADDVEVEITPIPNSDAVREPEPANIEVQVTPEPVKAEPIPDSKNTVNVNIEIEGQKETISVNPPPITKEEALAQAEKDKVAEKAIEKAKVEPEKVEPVEVGAEKVEPEKVEAEKVEPEKVDPVEVKVRDKDGNVVKVLIRGPDGKITVKPAPEPEKAAPMPTEAEIAKAKEEAMADAVGRMKAEAEEKAKLPVENDEQNSIVYNPAGKAIGQFDPKTQKVVLWAEQAEIDLKKQASEEEEEKALKVKAAENEVKSQALLMAQKEAEETQARGKAIIEAINRAKVKAAETQQKVVVTQDGKAIAEISPDGGVVRLTQEVVAKNTTVDAAKSSLEAQAEAAAAAKIEAEKKAAAEVDIVVEAPNVASLEEQIKELENKNTIETARQATLKPADGSPIQQTPEAEAISDQCKTLQEQVNKAREAGETTRLHEMGERIRNIQEGLGGTQEHQIQTTIQKETVTPPGRERPRDVIREEQQQEYSRQTAMHKQEREREALQAEELRGTQQEQREQERAQHQQAMERMTAESARPPSATAHTSYHPVDKFHETRNVAPRERHVESEPPAPERRETRGEPFQPDSGSRGVDAETLKEPEREPVILADQGRVEPPRVEGGSGPDAGERITQEQLRQENKAAELRIAEREEKQARRIALQQMEAKARAEVEKARADNLDSNPIPSAYEEKVHVSRSSTPMDADSSRVPRTLGLEDRSQVSVNERSSLASSSVLGDQGTTRFAAKSTIGKTAATTLGRQKGDNGSVQEASKTNESILPWLEDEDNTPKNSVFELNDVSIVESTSSASYPPVSKLGMPSDSKSTVSGTSLLPTSSELADETVRWNTVQGARSTVSDSTLLPTSSVLAVKSAKLAEAEANLAKIQAELALAEAGQKEPAVKVQTEGLNELLSPSPNSSASQPKETDVESDVEDDPTRQSVAGFSKVSAPAATPTFHKMPIETDIEVPPHRVPNSTVPLTPGDDESEVIDPSDDWDFLKKESTGNPFPPSYSQLAPLEESRPESLDATPSVPPLETLVPIQVAQPGLPGYGEERVGDLSLERGPIVSEQNMEKGELPWTERPSGYRREIRQEGRQPIGGAHDPDSSDAQNRKGKDKKLNEHFQNFKKDFENGVSVPPGGSSSGRDPIEEELDQRLKEIENANALGRDPVFEKMSHPLTKHPVTSGPVAVGVGGDPGDALFGGPGSPTKNAMGDDDTNMGGEDGKPPSSNQTARKYTAPSQYSQGPGPSGPPPGSYGGGYEGGYGGDRRQPNAEAPSDGPGLGRSGGDTSRAAPPNGYSANGAPPRGVEPPTSSYSPLMPGQVKRPPVADPEGRYFLGDLEISKMEMLKMVSTHALRKDGFGAWRRRDGSIVNLLQLVNGTMGPAHARWLDKNDNEHWETSGSMKDGRYCEDGWGIWRDSNGVQEEEANGGPTVIAPGTQSPHKEETNGSPLSKSTRPPKDGQQAELSNDPRANESSPFQIGSSKKDKIAMRHVPSTTRGKEDTTGPEDVREEEWADRVSMNTRSTPVPHSDRGGGNLPETNTPDEARNARLKFYKQELPQSKTVPQPPSRAIPGDEPTGSLLNPVAFNVQGLSAGPLDPLDQMPKEPLRDLAARVKRVPLQDAEQSRPSPPGYRKPQKGGIQGNKPLPEGTKPTAGISEATSYYEGELIERDQVQGIVSKNFLRKDGWGHWRRKDGKRVALHRIQNGKQEEETAQWIDLAGVGEKVRSTAGGVVEGIYREDGWHTLRTMDGVDREGQGGGQTSASIAASGEDKTRSGTIAREKPQESPPAPLRTTPREPPPRVTRPQERVVPPPVGKGQSKKTDATRPSGPGPENGDSPRNPKPSEEAPSRARSRATPKVNSRGDETNGKLPSSVQSDEDRNLDDWNEIGKKLGKSRPKRSGLDNTKEAPVPLQDESNRSDRSKKPETGKERNLRDQRDEGSPRPDPTPGPGLGQSKETKTAEPPRQDGSRGKGGPTLKSGAPAPHKDRPDPVPGTNNPPLDRYGQSFPSRKPEASQDPPEDPRSRPPGGRMAPSDDPPNDPPDSPLSPATLKRDAKYEKQRAYDDRLRALGGGKPVTKEEMDDSNFKPAENWKELEAQYAESRRKLEDKSRVRSRPRPDEPGPNEMTSRSKSPKPPSRSKKPKDPEFKPTGHDAIVMNNLGKGEHDNDRRPSAPPPDPKATRHEKSRKPKEPKITDDEDGMRAKEGKPMTEEDLLELEQAQWNEPRRKKLEEELRYQATGTKQKPKPKDDTPKPPRQPCTIPRTFESSRQEESRNPVIPTQYVGEGKDVQRKDRKPMTDEDWLSYREEKQAEWNLPRREKLAAKMGHPAAETRSKADVKPVRRALPPDHPKASQQGSSTDPMDWSKVVSKRGGGGPKRPDGTPLNDPETLEFYQWQRDIARDWQVKEMKRREDERSGRVPGTKAEPHPLDSPFRMSNQGTGAQHPSTSNETDKGNVGRTPAQQKAYSAKLLAEAEERLRVTKEKAKADPERYRPRDRVGETLERKPIDRRLADDDLGKPRPHQGDLAMEREAVKGPRLPKPTKNRPPPTKDAPGEKKKFDDLSSLLREQDIAERETRTRGQERRPGRDPPTEGKKIPEEDDLGNGWKDRYGNGDVSRHTAELNHLGHQAAGIKTLEGKVKRGTEASREARKVEEAKKVEEARKARLEKERLAKLAGNTTGTRNRHPTGPNSKTAPQKSTTTYPPKQNITTRHNATTVRSRSGSKSVSGSKPTPVVRSTSTPRSPSSRGLSAMGTYVRNAKFLFLFFLLQNVLTVAVARQFCVLIVSSGSTGGTGSTPGLTKRAEGDLPADMEYTNQWLLGNFGTRVDPWFAFILLNIWIGLSVLLSAYLYNAIIDATDNPRVGEKKSFGQKIKGVWRGLKKAPVGIIKALSMDRHPSLKNVRRRWGKWTLVRISIFLIQISLSTITLRMTIALNSLVAGAAKPTPSGPDIDALTNLIKDGAAGSTPGGAFLLLLFVLGCFVVTVTWSWHSLLHPRRDDRRPGRRGGIFMNIITLRILKRRNRPNLGPKTYKCVVGAVMFIVTAAFAFCIAWFSEIMKFTAEFGFVQDTNIGLVFPFTLFGLFIIPMAWVVIKLEDLVIVPLWRSCRGKKSSP